jgi:hypothetical protein
LEHAVSPQFFRAVLDEARGRQLLSAEHFTVDRTLPEAWASLKSFRPKDRSGNPPGEGKNPTVDFRAEERVNATHASTTDPEALLARKGKGNAAKGQPSSGLRPGCRGPFASTAGPLDQRAQRRPQQ